MGDGAVSLESLETRLARLEERVKTIFNWRDRFEGACKEDRGQILDLVTGLADRVDKFLNHEFTDMKAQIASVQRRNGWGRKEWLAIATTIILTGGNILIKLIEVVF